MPPPDPYALFEVLMTRAFEIQEETWGKFCGQWRFWHEVAEGLRGHLLHA